MKRQILMAGTAMLISLAAIAGNNTKTKTSCNGSCCTKACTAKCVCDTKKCNPATCKSTCTNCCVHSGKCSK
jgi:hypothetical protein